MILVETTDFIGQYALANGNADTPVIQSYIDREEQKTIYRLLGKTLGYLVIAYIQSTKPTATSGVLVTGNYYEITDYNAEDDFTNVGATSNATGQRFLATGTTPTTWTNGSTITTLVKRYEDIIEPFFIDDDTAECWCGDSWQKVNDSHGLMDLLLIQIYYCYLSEEQLITSQSGVVSQAIENGNVQAASNAYRKGEQKWNKGGLDTWYAIRWFCKVKYPDIYPEYMGQNESARYSSLI